MTATVYTGGATVELIARPPVAPPSISNFIATPSVVAAGQSCVLSAVVANAVTLALDGATVVLPATVTPTADHTYTLVATGVAGTIPATATVNVSVVALPVGQLVPILAGALHSSQFCWLADAAKPEDLLPRAVPWPIPTPKVPMNGQTPARVRVWHKYGTPQGLYSMHPAFRNGISEPFEPNVGSDIAVIADKLRANPPPVGPRGIAYLSPYGIPHDHPVEMPNPNGDGTMVPIPRAPEWMYLLHNGVMQLLYPDGSVQGTIQIPGIKYCSAWVVHEIDRRFFFVCNHGKPTYTTPSTWSGASVDLVFRGAGMGSASGPEDAGKYLVSTFKSSPLPLGVCCDEQGNVYIADHITGKITKTPTTIVTDAAGVPQVVQGVESLVATIPGIVAMAYHEGTLRCIDNQTYAFIVDIATGTVGPNLQTVLPQTGRVPYGSRFWAVSVDRNGTFGPKGHWSFTRDVGGEVANLDAYDFVKDLTSPTGWRMTAGWKGGQGLQRVGDYTTVQETKGHYPWFEFFHRWLPIKITSGVSGGPQLLIAYDAAGAAAIPKELSLGLFNYEIGARFQQLWRKGGVKSSPFNVPSLTCFTTKEGWSPFKGCSFDEMAERSFNETEAFILGGMIGQFPRNFPVGPDRYAVMYGVYSNSIRFLIESQGLMDKLDAWWVSKYGPVPSRASFFDSTDPVLGYPVLPKLPEDPWAVVKADGSGIEMWNMDSPQPTWTVPAGASIVYDQGLPTQSATKPNRLAAATVINLPAGYWSRAVVVA